MALPAYRDTVHRTWLLRLLSAIADNRMLAASLHFKGGTYAQLRGLLDRFSVDLDFDLINPEDIPAVRGELERLFVKLHLAIKDASSKVPQYFLRYPSEADSRNTIALDITCPAPKANKYESVFFPAIDRFLSCQTITTMVANKLVAPLDRFLKHGSIAGRDIFDIHTFLLKNTGYDAAVIKERIGKDLPAFFKELHQFIKKNITQTIVDQDLNTLLPADSFHQIRKVLKQEVLRLIEEQK